MEFVAFTSYLELEVINILTYGIYEPLFVFLPWTPQMLEEGLFLYMFRFYSCVLVVYM